ncbi:pancreatic lipase-related protein 2-like [Myotis daubentonii]|uniref:pancreatic lipase-related protein 2-like n=1 Tax=Myotis daubentonii TaxID=98922 RepID=UPI0028733D59|nr:pancreatic lipase-related protein 2-like [Myotis daubentonii]XP_059517536.1 pancreatic lipase-related protein 2-like [Myotis daubentonii]
MLPSWIVGLLLLATVRGKEVCYEPFGCFSNEKPWTGNLQRPLKLSPWSPKDINTRFLLYTNENPNSFQRISSTDLATVNASNFHLDRKTRFIIHGFIDKGEERWLRDMCQKMFKVEKVNCICVDWMRGARTGYNQAVHNIRVVGAETAFLIEGLSTKMGYSLENVHIIGHSLGAHAAGEAGRRLGGCVGRITGLDPAEPGFQGMPEEVRLDPSDAMFVDVIHTDTSPTVPNLGFGMSQKVGHLDFYPNGGQQMPGCQKNTLSSIVDKNDFWEGTRDLVSCNHLRSYKYYSSSILNPDGFLGYPCASYEEFQKNGCFPCPVTGCPKMGHYADQFQGNTSAVGQTFFLNTGASGNFARWRYRVSVTLAGNTEMSGSIGISLYGSNGTSKQYEIFKGSLKPDAKHVRDIDVDINVGKIQKVMFLWNNQWINMFWYNLGASNITVQSGEYGTEYHFCSGDTVKGNQLQTLLPC